MLSFAICNQMPVLQHKVTCCAVGACRMEGVLRHSHQLRRHRGGAAGAPAAAGRAGPVGAGAMDPVPAAQACALSCCLCTSCMMLQATLPHMLAGRAERCWNA